MPLLQKWNLNPNQFFSMEPSNSMNYYCKHRLWFNSWTENDIEQFFVIGTSEYLATNKRWIQLDRTTKAAFYSIKMCWLLHSFFNGKLMLQLGETVMFIAEAITAKLLFRALIIDDSKAKLALGQHNSTMS